MEPASLGAGPTAASYGQSGTMGICPELARQHNFRRADEGFAFIQKLHCRKRYCLTGKQGVARRIFVELIGGNAEERHSTLGYQVQEE
jgi:hypothetical protein